MSQDMDKDTSLLTKDPKFEPSRSVAELAVTQATNIMSWQGRNNSFSFYEYWERALSVLLVG